MTVRYLAFFIIFTTNIRLCYCKKSYDKYSLYHVTPMNDEQVSFLRSMDHNKFLDVIFWNTPILIGKPAQLLVHKRNEKDFHEKTDHYNMKKRVIVENVQDIFDEQVVKQDAFNPHKSKWEHFHTLDDIYKYLNQTARNYSEIASLEVIGKSAEGRDILAFTIREKTKYKHNKVIMEAGIHGNEWLGTTFVLYFIDELLTDGYEPLKELKFDYIWYFIPVLNPDGYVYSQTEDRLWRKNRRKTGEKTVGVDLNRNFNYQFGLHDTTAHLESDRYHGPHEFSEPETKALRDFVERKYHGLTFYFSFHGYGQKIILPYADSIKHKANYHEMQQFIKYSINKIDEFSNRKYLIGTAYELLGTKFSGDSASWIKKTYRVPFVYTILLRDDDEFGHALRKQEILPACAEMKVGVAELLKVTPKYLNLRQVPDTGAKIRVFPITVLLIVNPFIVKVVF